MLRIARWIMAVLLVMLGTAAAQQAAKIRVQLTLNGRPVARVYEGQSVQYVITLQHAEKTSRPELQNLDDFDVAFLGEETVGYSRIVINNRVVQDIRGGVQYRYQLTPRKTGTLRIPGPAITVDGHRLVGQPQTLEVVPADQQDVVRMEMTVDREFVYPMQPFAVTLSVAVRGLPEPHTQHSPLSVQDAPPALKIPWALDEHLPDGIEPKNGWQEWLGPLQKRRGGGFQVNNIGRSSVFSLFEDSLSRFAPQPRKVRRRDTKGVEAEVWLYEFQRQFVATKIGQYGFGPVTLQGSFATAVDPRRPARFVGEDIYAVAQAIKVTVKDAHLDGRPETFTGAIGQFQLSANLEPTQAKVGDPMTLTLELNGEGTFARTAAPDLKQIPGIADRFKIHEGTASTSRTSCRFTYSLRPLDERITQFPPVAIAYFDVDEDRYITLQTNRIPIEVSRADRLADNQIVSGGQGSSRRGRDLQARREGISANVTELGAMRDQRVRPGRWIVGLTGLVGLYVAVLLVTVQVRRVASDAALLRRRGAPVKAQRRLRGALATLNAGHVREGVDQVQAALTGLVADAADVPEAGLTPKDAHAMLVDLGAGEDLAAEFRQVLEACDAARYGAFDRSPSGFATETETLVHATIQVLKANKRRR